MGQADYPDGQTTKVETITPTLAQVYLEGRTHNRTVRDAHVKELALEMTRGQWHLHHQGIAFDWDECLIDGQHRLYAVFTSGVTIRSNVSRGVDPSTFKSMDVGASRTPGDIFHIIGEKDSTNLAAAAGWLWRYQNNKLYSDLTRDRLANPTHDQRVATITANPGLRESLSYVKRFTAGTGRAYRGVIPLSVSSFLHYEMSRIDDALADRMFQELGTGVNLTRENPVYVLRECLLRGRERRMTAFEQAAYVIICWNLLMRGQTRRVLTWRPADMGFPVMDGTPKPIITAKRSA